MCYYKDITLVQKDVQLSEKTTYKIEATTEIKPMVCTLQFKHCGSKPELQQVKELISDSFELLANVSMDMNFNRREALRPDLKNRCKHNTMMTRSCDTEGNETLQPESKTQPQGC